MFTPGESDDLARLQRTILDHLADAVIALDRHRRIVFWNCGAERLCRLSASQTLGQRPSDVQLAPWFSAAEEEAIFSALEHAETWRREALYSIGNGATEHVEQTITALSGPDGSTLGFLVVMRNISSAKHKEREHELHIEALRAASDRAPLLDALIPICSHCKQIRDQRGAWHEPDAYLHEHFNVRFTHGICPGCIKRLHPEYFGRRATLP